MKLKFNVQGKGNYWSPSVIKIGDKYYTYTSFDCTEGRQHMHVFQSDSPEGSYEEKRTARICKLIVKDGTITAVRFEDKV